MGMNLKSASPCEPKNATASIAGQGYPHQRVSFSLRKDWKAIGWTQMNPLPAPQKAKSGSSGEYPFIPCPHEGPLQEKGPPLAYNNRQFLYSPAARAVRVQCELLEPEYRLRNMGVHNTIVFFGSARSVDGKTALERLDAVRARVAADATLSGEEASRQIAAAEQAVELSRYYDAAQSLAYQLTTWSKQIQYPHKRFYICSGGGPGMMEAANRGAKDAGGQSLGLGISLPFEQHINQYVTPELAFEFHYFFVRKYWFIFLARALILFPGGFGTFDEMFEVLTLIQTQKVTRKFPVILFGREFWSEVINFKALAKWGVISPEDINLFHVSDSVEEVRDYIIADLTARFLDQG